jgi:hypothetical protein
VFELKNLVLILRRIVGVELSERSLKTGTSTLENVAGATSVYYPMSTSYWVPGKGLTAEPAEQLATFAELVSSLPILGFNRLLGSIPAS